MSLLSEIKSIIEKNGLKVETGVFSSKPPDEYAVITPLTDDFPLNADNQPLCDEQGARVSVFAKNNYQILKNKLVKSFIKADFTITDRQYIGYENDTGYHHYVIDVAKAYDYDLEE